jgi:hypothetical protein
MILAIVSAIIVLVVMLNSFIPIFEVCKGLPPLAEGFNFSTNIDSQCLWWKAWATRLNVEEPVFMVSFDRGCEVAKLLLLLDN